METVNSIATQKMGWTNEGVRFTQPFTGGGLLWFLFITHITLFSCATFCCCLFVFFHLKNDIKGILFSLLMWFNKKCCKNSKYKYIFCRVVPFVGQQTEIVTQVNKHSKTQGLTKSASKGTHPVTCLPVNKTCPEDVS